MRELELADVLDRTNDWLKFAEAKNGALLALQCAVLVGICQAIATKPVDEGLLPLYLLQGAICILCGITLGIASLLPRLSPPFWITFPKASSPCKILFFGDICSHNAQSYLKEYYACADTSGSYSKLYLQIAEQIVTNSRIAFIKYKQFNACAWLLLAAVMTPLGALIYSRFRA